MSESNVRRGPTGALPMPASGRRTLSPTQARERALALRCMRDQNPTQCQGKIHINVFFDGTGNNHDWEGTFTSGKTRSTQTQRARNSHSNVVRLWDAAYEQPDSGMSSIYVPGVGTPFPEINDDGGFFELTAGAAAGRKGADRINYAIVQIYNEIARYSRGTQLVDGDEIGRIVNDMSRSMLSRGFADWALAGLSHGLVRAPQHLPEDEHRRMRLKELEDQLNAMLTADEPARRVLEINISVFGFSRGAAQARAFVHWLFEIAHYNNNQCARLLAGRPLRLKFMGLFDTVASVGIAAMSRVTDGKFSWASGRMMSVHPDVEQCVHFAALHEQRINFPVDLVERNSRVREVLYPGMHSDVGGGYTPGSQGKGMPAWGASPNLSQIPLVDMHLEALKAGVFLKSWDEIETDDRLRAAYSCDSRLINTYNAWLSGHGIGGGDHGQQIREHSQQYAGWHGLRFKAGEGKFNQQRFYKEASSEDQDDLRKGQRWLGTIFFEKQINLWDRWFGERALHNAFVSAEVPSPSVTIFDDYVHDSLAGFYMWRFTELSTPLLRTDGYLRYREQFNVRSGQVQSICAPHEWAPNYNNRSMDQLIGEMGRAMGGM